jgi:hypothetical protein
MAKVTISLIIFLALVATWAAVESRERPEDYAIRLYHPVKADNFILESRRNNEYNH